LASHDTHDSSVKTLRTFYFEPHISANDLQYIFILDCRRLFSSHSFFFSEKKITEAWDKICCNLLASRTCCLRSKWSDHLDHPYCCWKCWVELMLSFYLQLRKT